MPEHTGIWNVEMLAKLGAGLKGNLGVRLNYFDLAALAEPSLVNPELSMGELTESFYRSWAAVTGKDDRLAFKAHWRDNRFLPHLRVIAEQPTPALQRWKLRDLLLDEEERGTVCIEILKLPKEQADEVFVNYPNGAAADESIAWKRDYAGLEFGYYILNKIALEDLARRGFGIKDLRNWLDLYTGAYELVLRHRFLLGAMWIYSPQSSWSDDPVSAATGRLLSKMDATLAAMRDDISNGRGDIERYRELYNSFADAEDELHLEVGGGEPPNRGDRIN